LLGITIHAFILTEVAAKANADPWLPDECVQTPLFIYSSVKDKIEFIAPLNLKEPLFYKLSTLKYNEALV